MILSAPPPESAGHAALPRPPPQQAPSEIQTRVAAIGTPHGPICANYWDLAPGDVLLFRGGAATKGRRIIRAYQAPLFGEEAAQWFHVALVVDEARAAESVRGQGVQEVAFKSLFARASHEGEEIAARRMRAPPPAQALRTAVLGYDGARYARPANVFEKALRRLFRKDGLTARDMPDAAARRALEKRLGADGSAAERYEAFLADGLVCSQFVDEVLRLAHADEHRAIAPSGFPTPADFAQSVLLDPVPIRWHRL